jgi:hypothetical protein
MGYEELMLDDVSDGAYVRPGDGPSCGETP